MILPISDEPNPRATPVVTIFLVALNLGIWVLFCWPMSQDGLAWDTVGMPEYLRVMHEETGQDRLALFRHASAYDLFTFRYGFRPNAPSAVALLLSLFLHGGWLHVAGNMLMLWIFGDNVEARLGRARFLLTYLVCGVVATLAYAAARPQSALPLIGASGAISGILGCYFIWFPRYRVRVLATLLVFWWRFTVPAWLVLSFYLVVENLLPLLLERPAHATGVAHGAHVGGFVAGAFFAVGRNWGVWASLPNFLADGYAAYTGKVNGGHGQRARSTGGQAAPHLATMRRWLGEGAYEDAFSAFLRLPRPACSHVTADEALVLADWLTAEKNYAQAQAILAELADTLGRADPAVAARASLRQGLLAWRGQNRTEAACTAFRRALAQSGGVGEVATAARAYLDQIGGYGGG